MLRGRFNREQPLMPRLYFVEWLRVFLIALVVAHHAGQAYGPTGGEWPVRDPSSAEWLGPFFAINAAFFMGFFFLIAGYFTGSSYDRKGGSSFIRDRLVRLGLPLAFVTLFVFGPLAYLISRPPGGFLRFFIFDYVGRWQIEMGHMWFVAQLLAYSLLYALWRWVLAANGKTDQRAFPLPSNRAILIYVLALGLIGGTVRLFYPQDAWVTMLWLVPAEPAHLPQYVSMFAIGIVAGRGHWFTDLPPAVGKRWFAAAVVAAVVAFALASAEGSLPAFVNLDFVWGVLEAFVCVGLILGLLVFFRRYLSQPSRWLGRLDANVYGVYIVHPFILFALQAAIIGIALPATVKFLAVTAVGLAASFALAAALRQIPAVRRVV